MARGFQRCIEDFVCDQCGASVTGSGYTNHCPKCLYSKHVDNNPGDREAQCGGAMEPIRIEQKAGGYTIVHRCLSCGIERRNRSAENDDFEALVRLCASKTTF